MFPCTPLNEEFGLDGVVTDPPAPEMMLHEPEPIDGEFAPSVADVPQMFWSEPANAGVGLGTNVTDTSSMVDAHGALDTVQRNAYVVPARPVNVEEGLEGDTTLPPAPERMLQLPVPTEGELAANNVEVPQSVWFNPAFAADGV